MDFLVVSDSKLKIMLTREDMKKYEIDGEDIDYDDPRIRRSFWRILDEARVKCGFEAAGDKVLIQFYPSKDGSEIFVTKLGLLSAGAERTIARSNKVAMLSTRKVVYRFSDEATFSSAKAVMDKEIFAGDPRVFVGDHGEYYVIFDERRYGMGRAEAMPISEYGAEIPSNLYPYIYEHAREIRCEQFFK